MKSGKEKDKWKRDTRKGRGEDNIDRERWRETEKSRWDRYREREVGREGCTQRGREGW